MSVGFQAFRDDGKLQFDSNLMTLTCIASGSVTTQDRSTASVGNTTPSIALVPVPSTTAIVAVRGEGFAVSRFGVITISGQLYWSFATNAAIGTALSYWTFDLTRNQAIRDHGFGMQAFREDGSLYFDSELPIMIGAGLISGGDPALTLPDGRTYAVIAQDLAGHNQSTDPVIRDGIPLADDSGSSGGSGFHNWQRRIDGKLTGVRFDGATARIVQISFDDVLGNTPGRASAPDPPTVFWSIPLTNALLIDVTGI
jgi:hypothetical protein